MDLSKYNFLAPPTLLPLLQFMQQNRIYKYRPHEETRLYLEKVLGREECTNTTIPLRKLKKFNYGDYFQAKNNIEIYLDELTNEIVDLLSMSGRYNTNCINTIFYEMLTNIYKHSLCEYAYILCQEYPSIDKVDVCVIDNGITIPGSFENENIEFFNDSEAIFDAVNCKTTDKEDEGLHGRGLNTIANLTSFGYGEELLISSRGGTCVIDRRGIDVLPENKYYINGTFLSLRLNTNEINIYDYLEKNKIKRCENE